MVCWNALLNLCSVSCILSFTFPPFFLVFAQNPAYISLSKWAVIFEEPQKKGERL